jgi:hypothetical protein
MTGQRLYAILLLLLSTLQLAAQNMEQVSVTVVPTFHQSPLVLEHTYPLHEADSISFETLRFYLSALAFYKSGRSVYAEPGSYHLMDLSDDHSMKITLTLPAGITYDSIGFNMGVDSIMNTSGAQSGDLDPVNGMYWAWQSGYVNIKLEGSSNLCATRQHMFQFHLGGYLAPNNALQHIGLPVRRPGNISVEMPIDRFINSIDLRKENSVMIPCAEAVTLSERLARLFEIKP